jgi:hypothetical protein
VKQKPSALRLAAEIVRKIYKREAKRRFRFDLLPARNGYVHFVPFDAGESCPLLC